MKVPALRSRHHADVSFDENMTFVKTLMARIASKMVCALNVLHAHRSEAVNHCTNVVAMLSNSEPRDSKNRPAMVRRFSERRSFATNGDLPPLNSEA